MKQLSWILFWFLLTMSCVNQLNAQNTHQLHLVQIDTAKSFLTYQIREFKIEYPKSFSQSYQIKTSEAIIEWNWNDTLYVITTKAGDFDFQITDDSAQRILFDTIFQVRNNSFVKPEWSSATLNHFPGMTSWEEQRVFSNFMSYKLLNQQFPAFKIISADGDSLSNESLNNKITVINFWYYGCYGCILELPALNELCKSFSDNPRIQFYSFFNDSVIERNDSLFFLTRITSSTVNGKVSPQFYDACYRQLPDAKYLTDQIPIFVYPVNLIVDCDGIVRFIIIGGYKNSKAWIKMMKGKIEQQAKTCGGG